MPGVLTGYVVGCICCFFGGVPPGHARCVRHCVPASQTCTSSHARPELANHLYVRWSRLVSCQGSFGWPQSSSKYTLRVDRLSLK
eukprot:3567041-Amphidinium_carterae.1